MGMMKPFEALISGAMVSMPFSFTTPPSFVTAMVAPSQVVTDVSVPRNSSVSPASTKWYARMGVSRLGSALIWSSTAGSMPAKASFVGANMVIGPRTSVSLV